MTLPFDKSIVNDEKISPESFRYPHFVGYLNPNGIPVDYSEPFGLGGHDNNPTTDLFIDFFYIRYQEYNIGSKVLYGDSEYEEKEEKRFCSQVIEDILEKLNEKNIDINYQKNSNQEINKFDLLERDLLVFFKNCYLNGTFNNGLGKYIRLMDKKKFRNRDFVPIYEEFLKQYPERNSEENLRHCLEFEYEYYINTSLLDLLKEIFISYLGYHSIERIPRTITTSSFNIYETFYNYLLNDFNIVQIPKMIYDDDKKMYVPYEENEFLVSDSELRLKEEIQSIKRLVPINEREKYYR